MLDVDAAVNASRYYGKREKRKKKKRKRNQEGKKLSDSDFRNKKKEIEKEIDFLLSAEFRRICRITLWV